MTTPFTRVRLQVERSDWPEPLVLDTDRLGIILDAELHQHAEVRTVGVVGDVARRVPVGGVVVLVLRYADPEPAVILREARAAEEPGFRTLSPEEQAAMARPDGEATRRYERVKRAAVEREPED
jgi:hypothetical protein